MNQVNRIVYSRRDFKKEEELYAKLAQQIQLLMETGNTVVLKDADEGKGTIVLDFSATDGPVKPFWLTKNEMICALDAHMNAEIHHANEVLLAADAADRAKDILGDLTFGLGDDSGEDDGGDDGNNGRGGAGNA